MEHAVTQVILLLIIAAFAGMGARRLAQPYTLALVVAGTGIGFFHLEALQDVHLTPDLLLAIFLPALLFEAAYHVDYRRFVRDAPAILLLAVPGVLVAVGVTASVSYSLLHAIGLASFEWGHAFLLGAVIAATDPISVLALFRTLGVDKRLYLIVEGESLLNDGVAVVVFIIVAAVIGVDVGHGHPPPLEGLSEIAVYGIRTFFWMGGVGVAVGGVLGLVTSVLTRQVDDRLVETTLSFVLAYGSFLAAEHLHASGVLSTVTAGIVLGSFGSRFGMSATTRIAIVDFWEFMAFFANSFVFLLVGIELDIPELLGHTGPILVVFLAVVVGRAAAVYLSVPLTRLMRIERIPMKWAHTLVWGGLRGSLSMVLVVGLPPDYPARRLLLLLVFGVVSISLFVQGLTMKPLLARLGITRARTERDAYERARARAMMAAHARRELAALCERGGIHPDVLARLQRYYDGRFSEDEGEARRLAGSALSDEHVKEAALHLLSIEEETLRHAESEGIVAAAAADPLYVDIAARRETLRHGDDSPEDIEQALAEVLGERR